LGKHNTWGIWKYHPLFIKKIKTHKNKRSAVVFKARLNFLSSASNEKTKNEWSEMGLTPRKSFFPMFRQLEWFEHQHGSCWKLDVVVRVRLGI